MWHLHLGAVSEDDGTHAACKPVPLLLKVKAQACTLHAGAYRKAGGHLRPGICTLAARNMQREGVLLG